MFGLTFEKLLLVGLIAAVVIGPHRLPGVVARFASLLGGLRRTVDTARERAAIELGVPVDASEWRALDPRRYDPRRIIAEAFAPPTSLPAVVPDPPSDEVSVPADHPPAAVGERASDADAPARVRRVRVGTSAHPRWIEVPIEAAAEASSGESAPDRDGAPAEASPASDAVPSTGTVDQPRPAIRASVPRDAVAAR